VTKRRATVRPEARAVPRRPGIEFSAEGSATFGPASGDLLTLKQLLESTHARSPSVFITLKKGLLGVIIVSCSWPVAVATARHSPIRLLSCLGPHEWYCNTSVRVVTPLNLRLHHLFIFWCRTPSTRAAVVPHHDREQGIGGWVEVTKPTTVVRGQNRANRSAGL
jgi:hypothetical protein